MTAPLRIGLSACFFHADPNRALFKGKTLLYLEESLAHWLLSEGALPTLVPTSPPGGPLSLRDLVGELDALILQGGADISPQSYGEAPLRLEWNGDIVRDRYEIALVKECLIQRKPLLGICRGAQLLNVALGGTLYQDITTQVPTSRVHRNWDVYDQLFHAVRFTSGSLLETYFPAMKEAKVNSIHHQGIKDLGSGLVVEAISVEDGIIEAVRLQGDVFAYAFQWHPEFHDPLDPTLLDGKPLLRKFIARATTRKRT